VLDELTVNTAEAPDGMQPVETGVIDISLALKLLEEVEPLLKSGSPECRKMMDDIRAIPGSDELIRQMEDYDFDAAVIALSDLLDALRVNR